MEKEAVIRTWQEDESPYELLVKTLKDRGAGSGRVGIEETVKFVFADGIAHAGAPSFQVVSATPVTAGCRMIKDAHEIERRHMVWSGRHQTMLAQPDIIDHMSRPTPSASRTA